MKRIFIIVGILIAAIAVVTAGMLLRGSVAPEGPSGNEPTQGTLPIPGTGAGTTGNGTGGTGTVGDDPSGGTGNLPVAGVSAIAQAAVIDYVVTAQGVTFIATNGAVISSASGTEPVAQANFGDLAGAWFSPDGKWLLVKSGTRDLVTWNILNVDKRTWKGIQVNTSEMVWSPNGTQLAYIARRTDGGALNTYSPTTGISKTLLTLSAPDLVIQWKDAAHIFLMGRPTSRVPGAIWEFGMAGSTLTPFADSAAAIDLLWGGARSGGLLFKGNAKGGALSMVNSTGGTTQNASFLTLPSKCYFGEKAATSTIADIANFLFCAVPQDQQMMKERPLPDDYLMGKFGTTDSLYAVNLLSGNLKQIVPAAQGLGFDVENMKVYGGDAYFVNRNDRKLYKVSLAALAGG